jgi:hypothetical protein
VEEERPREHGAHEGIGVDGREELVRRPGDAREGDELEQGDRDDEREREATEALGG